MATSTLNKTFNLQHQKSNFLYEITYNMEKNANWTCGLLMGNTNGGGNFIAFISFRGTDDGEINLLSGTEKAKEITATIHRANGTVTFKSPYQFRNSVYISLPPYEWGGVINYLKTLLRKEVLIYG